MSEQIVNTHAKAIFSVHVEQMAVEVTDTVK
jgi:hypothetical protein